MSYDDVPAEVGWLEGVWAIAYCLGWLALDIARNALKKAMGS